MKNVGNDQRNNDELAVVKRFGEIITQELWGIVPYALYKYQVELGLNSSEMWFLTWVIMHRWSEKDPYPSINALARRSGMSRQGIQVIVRKLKIKGLIAQSRRAIKPAYVFPLNPLSFNP